MHVLVVEIQARKMLENLSSPSLHFVAFPAFNPLLMTTSNSSHFAPHPFASNIFLTESLTFADGTAILTLLSPGQSESKRETRAARFEATFPPAPPTTARTPDVADRKGERTFEGRGAKI